MNDKPEYERFKMGRCIVSRSYQNEILILEIGAYKARPSFTEVMEARLRYAPPDCYMGLIFPPHGEDDPNPYIHRLIQIDEHTQTLMDNVREWSDKTFGTTEHTVFGKMNHLIEELGELSVEITKTIDARDPIESEALMMEVADVNILWLDICSLLGLTAAQVNRVSKKKLDIIKTRKYGPPDENGISRHIKQSNDTETEI